MTYPSRIHERKEEEEEEEERYDEFGVGHRPTYAGYRACMRACVRACVQLLYHPSGLGRWVTRFARCARPVYTRQPMGIDLWSERTAPPSLLSTPLLSFTIPLQRGFGPTAYVRSSTDTRYTR